MDIMKTMLNIKTDSDLKKKAQAVASSLGLPLSVILNNYLKELVATERVVFENPLTPNKKTGKMLNQALKDIQEGKNDAFSPAFDNIDDAVAWLND
jgi:addiction module RelB/DinJ family antitoxin